MTFAPGCNDVSLIAARPNSISGAPKLHSQVNPTKSICPFQYLEIINFSKLRYYKRKLLVNLFSHRSGWMWSLPAPGTLKGQGGHFIFLCIPSSLVGRLQRNMHNAVGQKKERPRANLPGQTGLLYPSSSTIRATVTTEAVSKTCSSTRKSGCRAELKNQAKSTPSPEGKANKSSFN